MGDGSLFTVPLHRFCLTFGGAFAQGDLMRVGVRGWRGRLAAAWAMLLPIVVSQAGAEPVPVGSELRVDTTPAESQRFPAAASTGDGFVVVWTARNFDSPSPDGDLFGVFGQRLSGTGAALGSEFQVNSFTTGNQRSPAVAADVSGRFVVVWEGVGAEGVGIFAQRYDSAGNRSGNEFQVATGNAFGPRAAADAGGSFVVVWYRGDDGGAPFGVFGQRLTSAGVAIGSQFLVNTYTTGSQRNPAVAADSLGNFVVVWESLGQDGSAYGVFGQRFSSDATPRGSEFRVNMTTADNQRAASVAADDDGGFVVAWQSNSGQTSYDVRAQRFDSGGNRLGSTFQVNTYSSFNQRDPDVTVDAEGRFTIVWASEVQDGDGRGVFGQQFDSTGAPNGSEFRVNTTTAGDQDAPAVSALGDGFLVVWDGRAAGVFAQRFAEPTPSPTPTRTPVPGSCPGDCDGGGEVVINELVLCTGLTVTGAPSDACPACDSDRSGRVMIDELLSAIDAGLNGCPE
jgi:hypothetical protein